MKALKTVLPALVALLLGAAQSAPLVLQGQLRGEVPPDLSVGIWTVGTAGQPQQLLGTAPAPEGRWRITLEQPPSSTPELQGAALHWPGVLPPVQVSVPSQGQELRAYAFVDRDRNGQPGAGEPLREVRLRDGSQSLFLVWVDRAVQVSAAHGYQLQLQPGWNALGLHLGKSVQLRPYSGQPLDARLSP
ncbi:hypothetical protein GCM10017783_18940 [Deinococcus piscis]|uniref:Uncharacterized protein n=1 Tax=Deinococcus piscis TaxID=394230 RepID=A0ABQ3K733_9DEIO|nr:hypothetical protein [Deinococcus piscis]GHG06500.1 hypothetical protein GCM10017783_18940 [Deinococcus piscis]